MQLNHKIAILDLPHVSSTIFFDLFGNLRCDGFQDRTFAFRTFPVSLAGLQDLDANMNSFFNVQKNNNKESVVEFQEVNGKKIMITKD